MILPEESATNLTPDIPDSKTEKETADVTGDQLFWSLVQEIEAQTYLHPPKNQDEWNMMCNKAQQTALLLITPSKWSGVAHETKPNPEVIRSLQKEFREHKALQFYSLQVHKVMVGARARMDEFLQMFEKQHFPYQAPTFFLTVMIYLLGNGNPEISRSLYAQNIFEFENALDQPDLFLFIEKNLMGNEDSQVWKVKDFVEQWLETSVGTKNHDLDLFQQFQSGEITREEFVAKHAGHFLNQRKHYPPNLPLEEHPHRLQRIGLDSSPHRPHDSISCPATPEQMTQTFDLVTKLYLAYRPLISSLVEANVSRPPAASSH